MNRLHFHLVDDEGWRIEIPGLEELTVVGSKRGHSLDESECLHPAYGSGWNPNDPASLGNGYFSRADFIEILQFAAKRHIKVIPEIDIPGHSRAAIKSMNVRYHKYISTDPAKANEYLLTDFADTSRYVSAQGYNDNTLNAALPSVYRFIEKVVDEIVSMYNDAGLKLDILHLGGDEIPHGAWEGSPLCHSFMQKENIAGIQGLKDYFWGQALSILKKRGLQPAGWQEISLRDDGSVNPLFVNENVLSYCWNTIPEWQDDHIPYTLANSGYPVILSNVTNFYLDFAYNKHPYEPGHYWGGFLNEVSSFNMLPFRIYLSVRKDLSGNPVDILDVEKQKLALKPAARQQIIGVNGQLWAETIRSYDMMEYLLFPKMFGLIERGWNAQPDWSLTDREEDYQQALLLYRSKIYEREIPRLAKLGVNFRVMHPGIKIIDGELHVNCFLPQATIHYTTDGSEPTTQSPVWTKPVKCNAKTVKAIACYKGKESVTTILMN
jgi:hexosaminidase